MSRVIILMCAATCWIVSGLHAQTKEGPPLCDGRGYRLRETAIGVPPHVTLILNGMPGSFLLDYGATKSSLWTDYVPRPGATVRVRTSIPGISSAEFLLRHADTPPNANDPVGVIGTDILSRVTMEFNSATAYLSVKSCSSVALRGAGFIPVNQTGFFSSDPTLLNEGRPNVPVLFFGLGEVHVPAQIDTGYDDQLYPYSIDINQALFDRLHQSGFEMAMTGEINVATCDGHESRRVYAVVGPDLVIETEDAKPITRTNSFYLVLKPANRCGGIASISSAAAQLGASFLKLFQTIVFDPQARVVWIKGNPGLR